VSTGLGKMKHVSQYETDEWANARDRRRSRRQEELLYKLDLKASMKIYPSFCPEAPAPVYGHCRGQYCPSSCCPSLPTRPCCRNRAARRRPCRADGAAGRLRQRAPLPGRRADARDRYQPLASCWSRLAATPRRPVAAAANYLRAIDADAVMLCCRLTTYQTMWTPSIKPSRMPLAMVKDGALATFGIVPSAPETGYG